MAPRFLIEEPRTTEAPLREEADHVARRVKLSHQLRKPLDPVLEALATLIGLRSEKS